MNSTESSRELLVSRVFHAPRELVLKMWSDPAMITRWWGPRGFSTTTHVIDFQPGGEWRFTMHGPDGTDYPNRIRYRETGPDRIAYEHFPEGAHADFEVEVTLSALDDKRTAMDFRMLFPSAEERQRVVETYGAGKGLVETTGRLGELLADRQWDANPYRLAIWLPSDTEIQMVRTVKGPQQKVFDAYTNADLIRRWQGPRGYECPLCEFDARPGGKWRMVHVGPDGSEFRFHGEVVEVDAPNRVTSTFEFEGFPGAVQRNLVLFEEDPNGTKVTTICSFDSKHDRDQMLESGMEWGMNEGYERLDEMLAS